MPRASDFSMNTITKALTVQVAFSSQENFPFLVDLTPQQSCSYPIRVCK